MSGDALKKVQAGQPLRIPAAAYNSFIDAALDLQQRRMNQGAGSPGSRPRHPGALLVRNDTGGDLDRLAIATLGSVVIAPADNQEEFLAGPIFAAVSPVAGGNAVILLEPILSGKFGWAVVHGVTPAKVDMQDADHRRCSVAAGDTAKMVSGETGPIRILWVAGTSGEQWAVVYVRDGDEQVAVDADNAPGFLAEAFNDTGTSSAGDAIVKRDALQGDAPDQKVRLFVEKAGVPADWDEKVAVDEDNDPGYLLEQFNDAGTFESSQDALVKAEAVGTSPTRKVRLFLDASAISGYVSGNRQYLMHTADGTLQWIDAGDCSS